jgi:hypothetical protein
MIEVTFWTFIHHDLLIFFFFKSKSTCTCLCISWTTGYRPYATLKENFAIFYMLAKYVPGDIKYIFTKFYRHISTNNEANRKFVILICNFVYGLWRFSPIIALWDWNLKFGSLMLNSLHLKRSENCNLNIITVGKLNSEVNSYVPFWQITILNEIKCFISFIFTEKILFYNSHLYSLYVGSLLQLCSFCFTANMLTNIMDNFDNA